MYGQVVRPCTALPCTDTPYPTFSIPTKLLLNLSRLLFNSNTSPLYTQWASFFLFQLGFDDELGTPFVNLKHHSNSSKDKSQLHWDQSLTSSSLITNVSSFITLDRIKTMSSSYLCKQPFSKY